MIITFKLEGLIRSCGDEIIFDNCEELRLSKITDNNFNYDDFNCITKKFSWDSANLDCKNDKYFLEFISNGNTIAVITQGTTYIANDENKTFKVIN